MFKRIYALTLTDLSFTFIWGLLAVLPSLLDVRTG